MNEHQKVAQYVLEKMNTVTIPGMEAKTFMSAMQWLALIAEGKFDVQENHLAVVADNTDDGAGDEAAAEA